jgi:hypothetical protein
MVARTLYSLSMVTPETEGLPPEFVAAGYHPGAKRMLELTCDIEGFPGWQVVAEVAATDAGLQINRLTIGPWGDVVPPGGITTRMLRQVRTGAIIAAHRAAARLWALPGIAAVMPDLPDLSVSERAGRRGRDDRFYARWAAEYADALTRSANPVTELARRHHLSASQVRNLAHACRKRGMLTAAPPGRAGGELTARAIELLREH